jgi:uncharacterized phage infection (PIP) family protein YhgE
MADMFSLLFPTTAAQLTNIETMLGELMATFEEAKQAWVEYASDLKTQRDEAIAALTDAQSKAAAAAEALQQFQDDDAATDAQQLADQAQAFADELSQALDAVKEPPAEPPPLPDTPPADSGDTGNLPPRVDTEPVEPEVNPLA